MAYSIFLAPPAERLLQSLTDSVQKRIVKRLNSAKVPDHNVKKLPGEEISIDVLLPGAEDSFKEARERRTSGGSGHRDFQQVVLRESALGLLDPILVP